MKQTILFLAILVALTGTSLTSCKQSTKQQKREAFKQMVGYNMYFSRDLIDVADIVVTYTDSTGLDATDTLTFDKIEKYMVLIENNWDFDPDSVYEQVIDSVNLLWSAPLVVMDSLPARIALKVHFLPKPCSEQNKDTRYILDCYLQIAAPIKGSNWDFREETNVLKMLNVRGSNVAKALDIVNCDPVVMDYTISRKSPNSTEREIVKNE